MNKSSDRLHHRLQQQGDMPFAEFMHYALYDPHIGYYSSGLQKFGSQGDFITAPELTPLFGQTLARQCQQVLDTLHQPILFEFGAGSGRLCVDMLNWFERNHCLPSEYHILEVSHNLRQRQQALVQAEIPHLAPRVHWLERWPDKSFSGVIIANEVLDAMPVHRFLQTETQLCESFIGLDSRGELHESFKPCQNPRLKHYLAHALPHGLFPYLSEANLFVDGWISQCRTLLKEGVLFLIDYGFPRHEYYHPDRALGTLMCHHRHQAHSNPLLHVGEQDITAHVDFTHIAEAAVSAGFQVEGYTSQAAFLLANGLLSLLETLDEGVDRINGQQAVKQLLQPNEMGELFKVMALSTGSDWELTGFQLHDRLGSL